MKFKIFMPAANSQLPGIRFLAEEIGRYARAWRQYWRLVLSLGIIFGWLYSFPMMGPLVEKLARLNNVNYIPLVIFYLAGNITGFIISGAAGYLFKPVLPWFSLGTIPCVGLSVFVMISPQNEWLNLLFAIIGLFSGLVIICWAASFANSVEPNQRGRTLAMGAFIATLILQIITILIDLADLNLIIEILSFLYIWTPAFLIYWYRQARYAPDIVFITGETALKKPIEFWPILLFIFVINVGAGFMQLIRDNMPSLPGGFLSIYGLIPYLLLLCVAGSLADVVGRRINAILGVFIVGIGFMAVGLFTGIVQFILVQVLLVSGYAFLNIFTWAITADLSGKRWAPLLYATTIGISVLAILIGMLVENKIGHPFNNVEILTVCLGGVLSFIALAFILRFSNKILQYNPELLIPQTTSILDNRFPKADFTPREYEIVELLISGCSTEEILEKQAITVSTLKTHLRNIYRKVGVSNRLQFTLALMKDINNSKKDKIALNN